LGSGGSSLVNLTATGTVASWLGIAIGNSLEGVVGAYLVDRWARGREAFERPQDILRFTLLAGLISVIVSATIGVTSLTLGGHAARVHYVSIWITWWLGDAVGAVVAPLLLLWSPDPGVRWSRCQRVAGALALVVAILVVGRAVSRPTATR
jgi:integral membrane sensor domain MASE1